MGLHAGAQADGHGTEIQLRIRNVVFGSIFHVQPLAFDIADNSDNLSRLGFAVIGSARRNVLANGIFIGKIARRKRFIHYDHTRSFVIIVVSKVSTALDGNVECMEIVRSYNLNVGGWFFCLRYGMPFNFKGDNGITSAQSATG